MNLLTMINQIVFSICIFPWFRERAEFSHPARSRRAESIFIKKSFNLVWKPFNDLSYYVSKNLSVKPLSSTWIISVFITICSLGIIQP